MDVSSSLNKRALVFPLLFGALLLVLWLAQRPISPPVGEAHARTEERPQRVGGSDTYARNPATLPSGATGSGPLVIEPVDSSSQ
ncbi:MAG: hypothetical protein AB7F66_03960 [Bacteriovoracia bacterium]